MIPNSAFILDEIPDFNPISQQYDRREWYAAQKRKCIEGEWHKGKWCPPQLYFYVNFWNIEVEGGQGGGGKVYSRPWLRDIDWEKGYIYSEARGFSGFSDDDKYTCNEAFGPKRELYKSLGLWDAFVYKGYINPEDEHKTYVPAREYLRKIHPKNLGKPLYQNECKNVIDLESKGGGKSFWGTCMMAHNFLFDGAYDYDKYLQAKAAKEPFSSQTLVGAIDTSFSKDLINKFLRSMEERNFVGNIIYDGVIHPSPLYMAYSGTIAKAGGFIYNKFGSVIHHRAFKDDPFAGAGTRPSLVLLEEVGFLSNIEDVLSALNGTINEGTRQMGVVWMFGTGGVNKGLAAMHCKKIFYNPKDYNCLEFEDIYEGRSKIGLFVPAHMTRNHFKDPNNNNITNVEKARAFEQYKRNEKIGNKQEYAGYIVNYPEKPSEVFYSAEGTFFPTVELAETEKELLADKILMASSWKGFCKLDDAGKVVWSNQAVQPIMDHPYQASKMGEGCIEIYEHPITNPDGITPNGIYIAGSDTVDDDGYTGSLQSTFILNRITDRIVAHYKARHETAQQYYENLRLLLLYYNATCNYENSKKGMLQHFIKMKSAYLLCDTPQNLKNKGFVRTEAIGNKNIGSPANKSVNTWHRNLTKEYLLEDALGLPGKKNAHTIRSAVFLRELLLWNPEANFDDVSAFGMLMILRDDLFFVKPKDPDKKEKEKSIGSEFSKYANSIKYKH